MDDHAGTCVGDDILISIVNYRTAKLCIACLSSIALQRETLSGFRVVVADGDSGDDSVKIIEKWINSRGHDDWMTVIPLHMNGGFGWAHNQVMLREARSESPAKFVLLLNPDTIVKEGAIIALRRTFDLAPHIGCVGSQLVNLDGSLGGSAFSFPGVRREFVAGTGIASFQSLLRIAPGVITTGRPMKVDWVTGACVMFRVEALKQIGLFDEGFFLYHEEIELMHRLNVADWENWHEPKSRVVHHGGASTGVEPGHIDRPRRLPHYFYVSRRRYFALTGGKLRAWAANFAWLSGRLLFFLITRVLRGSRSHGTPFEFRDRLTKGFSVSNADKTPAIPTACSETDHAPAWQELYPDILNN